MKRLITAVMLVVSIASPAASTATTTQLAKVDVKEVRFQTRTQGTFVYLHMLRIEVLGGGYTAPASPWITVPEPHVHVFGCVVLGRGTLVDMACGDQNRSAFVMDDQMATARIDFRATSQRYRLPLRARLTAGAYQPMTRTTAHDYQIPSAGDLTGTIDVVARSTRRARISGAITGLPGATARVGNLPVTMRWNSSVGFGASVS